MAKVAFSKLGLKVNQDIKTIEFNGQNIEVKQYLPIQDKLRLISNIINQSMEQDTDFANPIKFRAFFIIELLEYYTNINFTDKMKEDSAKLFDLVESSGLYAEIRAALPDKECDILEIEAYRTLEAFYKYKNSAVGILDAIKNGYDQQSFDLESLMASIKDPEALAVLKEIAPLMA